MIKIALVDDCPADLDTLEADIMRYLQGYGIEAHVFRFSSAEELLEDYRPAYDVIFLDIEMPGTDGLAAAAAIRQTDQQTIIVFQTNMANLAINGYRVEALDFLVKPVDHASLELVLHKVRQRLRSRGRASVTVASKGSMRILHLDDIDYVEVRGHYVTYHAGGEKIAARGTLAQVEKDLERVNFLRCNRWLLVNVDRITAFENGYITVGGNSLEVSRANRRPLAKALADVAGTTR